MDRLSHASPPAQRNLVLIVLLAVADLCWAMLLVPREGMDMAAMALLTLVVFAEEVLARGRIAVYATAAALVAYGVAVIATPQALPSFAGKRAKIRMAAGRGMSMLAAPRAMSPNMSGGGFAPTRR